MTNIMIYLSFRFSFTVGGDGAAVLWGTGAEAVVATAAGLIEGENINAEGAEGVSVRGLGANEKPVDPEQKGVDEETAGVENVVGTEKTNDDDDDTGPIVVGATLKGAVGTEAAGAGRVEAAAVSPRFGNVASAEVTKAALLGG